MIHTFIKFNWKISSVISAFATNMAITYYDKVIIGNTLFSPIVEGCSYTSHVFYGISYNSSPVNINDVMKNMIFTILGGVSSVPIHTTYVYNKYVANKIIQSKKEELNTCMCGAIKHK